MTTKKAIIAVVLLIILIAAYLLSQNKLSLPWAPNVQTRPNGAPITRTEAPRNAVVPEKDSTNVPKDVVVPETVLKHSPSDVNGWRMFDIKIENDIFTPSSVIVNENDQVTLKFTATDKDYKLLQPDLGFKPQILKGAQFSFSFAADSAGQFNFFCLSCANASKPLGNLIIKPAKQ